MNASFVEGTVTELLSLLKGFRFDSGSVVSVLWVSRQPAHMPQAHGSACGCARQFCLPSYGRVARRVGASMHAQQDVSRRNLLKNAAIGATALVGLSACAGNSSQAAPATQPKPAIVVTSFGTSYASSRHATIGAIEADIREAYPDYDVRRAFTSQIIIDHVEKDTGRHIDNFEEAMDKLIAEGVKTVIVQPTHLMDGFEYTDIKNSLAEYESSFEKTALGAPLLATKDDQVAVAEAVKSSMARYEDDQTAICLMGHGTEAESNGIYATMQDLFTELGYKNYFVATVEATPTFDDVAQAAKAAGYTKAVLRPFMVVAGDHANNDMADEEDPESFASIMKAAGFEVTSVIEGLGQLDTIDEVYVKHVADAIASL